MTIERWAGNRFALAGLFALAALIGAGILFVAQRSIPGVPGGDRAQIEGVVHDYVLAHPEIIPQAMQILDDRRSGELIAANAAAITQPIGSAWAGNPKGDVTLVEYFDYNCGFCRASLPTVAALIESDPNLKVVYRELPVLSEESGVAAKLSVAAAKAGKFQAFHDALYAGGPVSDASMTAAARTAGLDPVALKSAAQDPGIDAEIQSNLALASQLRMSGTPSWIIGDRVISGAMPLERMQQEIAEARKAG